MRARLWPSTVNIYMEAHNVAFFSLKAHKAWKRVLQNCWNVRNVFVIQISCLWRFQILLLQCFWPIIFLSGLHESSYLPHRIYMCTLVQRKALMWVYRLSPVELEHLIPLVPPSISFGSAFSRRAAWIQQHSMCIIQLVFLRQAGGGYLIAWRGVFVQGGAASVAGVGCGLC